MGAQVMVGGPLYYPALPPGGRYRTDVSGFRARRFMGSIRLLDGDGRYRQESDGRAVVGAPTPRQSGSMGI